MKRFLNSEAGFRFVTSLTIAGVVLGLALCVRECVHDVKKLNTEMVACAAACAPNASEGFGDSCWCDRSKERP